MSKRLIILANRGPFVLRGEGSGTERERSVSGLVSALEPFLQQQGGEWVAWGGRTVSGAAGETGTVITVDDGRHPYTFREVLLSGEEEEGYYNGLANAALWPLCHCFVGKCHFDAADWEHYVAVNRRFAREGARVAGPHDLLWVHDYHLALVPGYLREQRRLNNHIAFFWHIPFPPVDVFSVLPWAADILRGLLGSDLLGFHTVRYVEHFQDAAEQLLDLQVDRQNGSVFFRGREVKVRALPMGIDWAAFAKLASDPGVRSRALRMRQTAGVDYILLGVDRLDYTKGILERLEAFELFLNRYPAYRRRVMFMQVAVPSRGEVRDYQHLKRRVEETVGRINGAFGEGWYVPVHYYHRGFDRRRLVALYQAAHVAVVSPLRDGLNLVAKEFIASRVEEDGVLLLSQFAGAAEELEEAVTVNPYDREDMAEKMRLALEMPLDSQQKRMRAMRRTVREHDLRWWLGQFNEQAEAEGLVISRPAG